MKLKYRFDGRVYGTMEEAMACANAKNADSGKPPEYPEPVFEDDGGNVINADKFADLINVDHGTKAFLEQLLCSFTSSLIHSFDRVAIQLSESFRDAIIRQSAMHATNPPKVTKEPEAPSA